ncbi:phiEco32-like amidoligase-type 2 protein [Paenibacillus cellulosilyticus]|uniref:PhiEco32-like amidoligase-type 2 protein n=1 Tax=Paenibacillus cellulosilyticus TaxID=375489 RepID=A0A2V2YTX2_9BACL|nr:hypothetical protein [Paenibacillus cellulosilyticus]PWW00655.1 phiEco32-like amidoligase-type 2 protein [Paenibacillus cellulosilyticus]QKS45521.1 hypothetical protein HUB94_14615 [Paenibacillus cellulosilyticus]
MTTEEQRSACVRLWDEREHPMAPIRLNANDALIAVSGSPRIHRMVDGSGDRSKGVRVSNAPWMLLAPGAGDALTDQAAITRRWSRAGLLRHAPSSGPRAADKDVIVHEALRDGWRVYMVSVFHLEVIAIQRCRSTDKGIAGVAAADQTAPFRDLTGPELAKQLASDPSLRRVARVAVRALYSIGLDLGVGIIAIDGDGRTAALAIKQVPMFREDDESSPWSAAFERFQMMYREAMTGCDSRQRILIGADPEFILLKQNGRLASADRYFGIGGGAGADALLVGQRLVYPVGELRPDPASTPDELAVNVRRQLIRADAKAGEHSLRWAAGAMPIGGVALGGHIHLSGVPLTSRLLRQLDRYVALPIAMIESDSGRRPRYGMMGDFRQQAHGGFEYRTLPSWLVSPAAAKAAFALTLLCAHDTWSLPTLPLLPEKIEEAFYQGDRRTLTKQLDSIAAELAAAPSYAAYAHWIEPLFAAARQGTVWDATTDIRRKWRVGPYAK